MKDTKIFFTLLIFSIAVVFTGCPEPVGSILYSVDYIKAVPSKTVYGKNEKFIPAQHVKIIGVFGGTEDLIDITKVNIKVIDPVDPNSDFDVKNNQTGDILEYEGLKTVVITHNHNGTILEARYDITVGAPGSGNVGWGSGGSGITIVY
jgi:hypothetical protein